MTKENNEEKKFISLLNDSTFKYLWKEERCRKWLEKVILLLTGINLCDYTLVDNELNSGNGNKDYRLDIVLKKENNIVNIEMNRYPSNYSSIKNHTYLYRLAGNPYFEGEDYKKIYVMQINFNNGYCMENKDIKLSLYEFMDKENNLKIEGIKDYEIYLGKCKEICYNEANKLDNYLRMFVSESYEELREFAGNDKEALIIVQELEKLSQEKYFGALYDARIVQKKLENSAKIAGREEGIVEGRAQGIAEGIKQGIEQGIEQGSLNKSIEIAKAMLKENIDIEAISKCTGLTIEEINKIEQ